MKSKLLKPPIRWWSLFNPGIVAHFTESLEVRSDRFVHTYGLFKKQKHVIHFSYIINYSTCQSMLDRLFGLANYCIESTAHPEAPALVLRGYTHKLRGFLLKMLQAYAQAGHQGEAFKIVPTTVNTSAKFIEMTNE